MKANREDLIVCFYNLHVSCTGSVLTTITIDPLFHTGYVRLTGRHARGLSSLYFLSQSASLSVSMEAQPYAALRCHLRGRQQGETAGRDMDSNCTVLRCAVSRASVLLFFRLIIVHSISSLMTIIISFIASWLPSSVLWRFCCSKHSLAILRYR